MFFYNRRHNHEKTSLLFSCLIVSSQHKKDTLSLAGGGMKEIHRVNANYPWDFEQTTKVWIFDPKKAKPFSLDLNLEDEIKRVTLYERDKIKKILPFIVFEPQPNRYYLGPVFKTYWFPCIK